MSRSRDSHTPAGPDALAESTYEVSPNFITDIVERDLASGKYPRVVTRFPPEPNGYLHLGHTYASFLDFQTAAQYGGRYHLRLDDTNPQGENVEYAEAIQDDLKWLGWDWGNQLYYASDNFERYYQYALQLIELGKAYVDSVSGDEMARLRGTATSAGTPSVYRSRSVAENLDLFTRMRAGEFPDGAHVLRAKIDLTSANMKLRDPVLYRILRAEHYRQGNGWCIYPMYDFQHPLQDAIEGVTHSMCSLEFVDNRAIYDWLMQTLDIEPRPHQYEFGRRSLEYTVVSKRKLRRLVNEGYVEGWDDPRMPTLRAARRLGVTPEAIKKFAASIGVSRTNRTVDLAIYENAVRDDLNHRSPRVMAVLDPLRVVLEGLPRPETLALPYWPHDMVSASPDGLVALPSGERVAPQNATREVHLGPELYIEREDFAPQPPKGFKRLTPGGTVRLRGAGIIRAEGFETDATGRVTLVRATWLGEDAKASGVIHWVEASSALSAEFRLYDRLFRVPNPEGQHPDDVLPDADPELPAHQDAAEAPAEDFVRFLNPDSFKVARGYVEASVVNDPPDTRYQFERQGYFWRDPKLSAPYVGTQLVFGRIISLRDSWSKPLTPAVEKGAGKGSGKVQHPPSKAAKEAGSAVIAAAAPAKATLTPPQQAEAERLRALGLTESDAAALAREVALGAYFQPLEGQVAAPQLAAWVVNELAGAIRGGRNRLQAADLPALAQQLLQGEVNSTIAREVLSQAAQSGEAPADLVQRRGLKVLSDAGELTALAQQVMNAHPDKVTEYRAGRAGLMGFFTGQAMRLSGGQADPQRLAQVLTEALGSSAD